MFQHRHCVRAGSLGSDSLLGLPLQALEEPGNSKRKVLTDKRKIEPELEVLSQNDSMPIRPQSENIVIKMEQRNMASNQIRPQHEEEKKP